MKTKLKELMPSIIFSSFGIVFIIVYTIIGDRLLTTYAQLLGAMLLCFLFPILGKLFHYRFPTAFNWILGAFVLLALYIAKGIDAYHLIPYYDKILHTTFGIIAAMYLYVCIYLFKGGNINLFGKIFIIILGAMGFGALWEIFEYICSLLFNVDPQLVYISLEQGINPIEDTMLDLVVTLIGSSAFSIVLIIDILTNKHIIDKFFEVDFTKHPQAKALATETETEPETTEPEPDKKA